MTRLNPEEPGSWLDDVWCDGALVIDLDRRELLWFEVELDWLPRVSTYLLESTWAGWTSVWAPSGLRGICCRIGRRQPPTEDLLDPDAAIDLIDPTATYAEGTVASITLTDGRTFAWECQAGIDDLVDLPVEQVLDFVMSEIAAGRIESSERLRWNESQPRLGRERVSGFHLDLSSHELHWWSLLTYALHGDRLSTTWPGWRSVCHGDDYEWHERTATLNGIRPSLDHDIAAVRGRVQREIGRRPANPAVRVVRMLSAEGRAASLSPAASAHVPATSRAAMPQLLAALTELETNGLVNLPPCRFLSAEGEVVSPAGNR